SEPGGKWAGEKVRECVARNPLSHQPLSQWPLELRRDIKIFFSTRDLCPTIRRTIMDLFDLKDEVAVVIGATGALGGAIAEGLGAAGAKVAIVGRNEERGQARVKAIEAKGGRATFVSADAVQKKSLHTAHEAIGKSLGAPTILVNAAGGN